MPNDDRPHRGPWSRAPGADLLPPARWDPDIRAGLGAMIVAHGTESPAFDAARPPYAALDWDETCIRGDISESWLAYLDEDAPTDLFAAYEAACRVDKRRAYIDLAVSLVGGQTEPEVRRRVRAAMDRALVDGRVAVRDEIRELVWAFQRHGWEVWVVTASPTAVVQVMAQQYGIPARRVLGMQSPIDAHGRYEHRISEPVTYRDGKAKALAQWVGYAPTFAAGDSDSDVPMFEAAPFALLIDRGERGDPALSERAVREGWWVQHGW